MKKRLFLLFSTFFCYVAEGQNDSSEYYFQEPDCVDGIICISNNIDINNSLVVDVLKAFHEEIDRKDVKILNLDIENDEPLTISIYFQHINARGGQLFKFKKKNNKWIVTDKVSVIG